MIELHRYWVTFDTGRGPLRYGSWAGLSAGCGVTAWTREDALFLLQRDLFRQQPMPPVVSVIEDIDPSTLDAGHILPNIGVVTWRGVWYPRLSG